jgi:hypothetical protein
VEIPWRGAGVGLVIEAAAFRAVVQQRKTVRSTRPARSGGAPRPHLFEEGAWRPLAGNRQAARHADGARRPSVAPREGAHLVVFFSNQEAVCGGRGGCGGLSCTQQDLRAKLSGRACAWGGQSVNEEVLR